MDALSASSKRGSLLIIALLMLIGLGLRAQVGRAPGVTGGSAGSGTTVTVANGTAALGTGAITNATCATVVTVVAAGVATTDDIIADFNADPSGVTGYNPAAAAQALTIFKYPTSGNVNFKVCNFTAGSITPGAITLNWRVVR